MAGVLIHLQPPEEKDKEQQAQSAVPRSTEELDHVRTTWSSPGLVQDWTRPGLDFSLVTLSNYITS